MVCYGIFWSGQLYQVVCMQWLPGGRAYPLIWPIRGFAAGQSTVREQNLDALYYTQTSHYKKAFKFHKSLHPSLHHSNKDTRKVQAFLFRSYNRSTQHRPCLTRNFKRSDSGFHIQANIIRRGLEKFKMFTVNKQKRHQWQIVEPQQKHIDTKSNQSLSNRFV